MGSGLQSVAISFLTSHDKGKWVAIPCSKFPLLVLNLGPKTLLLFVQKALPEKSGHTAKYDFLRFFYQYVIDKIRVLYGQIRATKANDRKNIGNKKNNNSLSGKHMPTMPFDRKKMEKKWRFGAPGSMMSTLYYKKRYSPWNTQLLCCFVVLLLKSDITKNDILYIYISKKVKHGSRRFAVRHREPVRTREDSWDLAAAWSFWLARNSHLFKGITHPGVSMTL